jgi:hypothetical protein
MRAGASHEVTSTRRCAMKRQGCDRIMSFERGFDAHPGIERVA